MVDVEDMSKKSLIKHIKTKYGLELQKIPLDKKEIIIQENDGNYIGVRILGSNHPDNFLNKPSIKLKGLHFGKLQELHLNISIPAVEEAIERLSEVK